MLISRPHHRSSQIFGDGVGRAAQRFSMSPLIDGFRVPFMLLFQLTNIIDHRPKMMIVSSNAFVSHAERAAAGNTLASDRPPGSASGPVRTTPFPSRGARRIPVPD